MEDKKYISYVEDSAFILPRLRDGVVALGDLWDCQRSKPVGEYLFSGDLGKEYLKSEPLKVLDYTLTHINGAEDNLKAFKVGGKLSVELYSGLIKIEGSTEFDRSTAKNLLQERLIIQYFVENYSVSLLPQAKEAMNNMVIDKLRSGSIKATHVQESPKCRGSVLGKLESGPISASLKAKLELLETMHRAQITVHSKPPMNKQPSNIKEMFQLVENIHEYISAEQHFKQIDTNITGVPIRFELVPVSQFIDIKVEKLYMELQDNILEHFRVMLVALRDFRAPGYIWNNVLEKEPRLEVVLSDSNSPLSESIATYEKELQKVADEYFARACKALKGYKIARNNAEDLYRIVGDHKACDHSVVKVYAKVEDFVAEGRKDLKGVHETDATMANADRILLTNNASLNNWMSTESNIKILLRTGGESADGVFRRLFAVSKRLSEYGIEVGIALPSISDGFSLTIKTQNKTVTYQAANVTDVLNIVGAAVGLGEPNETLFHSINASKFLKQLPLQQNQLQDLNELVSILSYNRGLYIAHSSMDSLERLSCYHTTNDFQWKLFVSLDALDTALDAVMALRALQTELMITDSEWIVGPLGISHLHAAPLLCIFRRGELRAVCLDNLDILILVHLTNSKPPDAEEPDYSILSPNSLSNSLYPDRAQYAIEVMKILPKSHKHQLNSVELGMTSFDKLPDQALWDALAIARSILTNDDIDIISTVASQAIRQNPEIERFLARHGWENSRFGKDIMSLEKCNRIRNELWTWLTSKNPFLNKVDFAKSAIEHAQSLKEIDDKTISSVKAAASAVAEDLQCPKDARERINLFMSYQFQRLCKEVSNILDGSLCADDEAFFHVMVLLSLLRQIPTPLNINSVLLKYVDRLELKDKDLENYLANHQLYHIVSLLAKYAYDPQLSALHRKLDQIVGINIVNRKEDHNMVMMLFNSLIFTDTQWSDLWSNSRFLYLVRSGIEKPTILATVSNMVRRSTVKDTPPPSYVPQDIRKKLKEYCNWEKVELPDVLNNVGDVIRIFDRIVSSNEVPESFHKVLVESLTKNPELESSFADAEALFYWNPCKKVFSEAWSLENIRSALQQLGSWNEREVISTGPAIPSEHVVFDLHVKQLEEADGFKVTSNHDEIFLKIHQKWQPVMGETLPVITPADFVRLREKLSAPEIPAMEMEKCVKNVLPFVIQKVKMWGGDVLHAENISALVQNEINTTTPVNGSGLKSGPKFGRRSVKHPNATTTTNAAKQSITLSRIDCISALLCSGHSTVTQDIVRILSQFPISLPLIIPDLQEEKIYKVMMPCLLGPTIKWESEPGVIVENHLFRSPFRMLVAVRLGKNPIGKSTILNQLMITKYMFSSRGEPGAERGRPFLLAGSVEFTWLTQETCSTSLWKFVLEKYYGRGEKAIVLLANLHGDAVEYPEVIRFLKQFTFAYLIFMMPDCEETKWDEFKQMADCHEQRLIYAMVDGEDDSEDEEQARSIDTRRLMEDVMLSKVRSMFDQALNSGLPTSPGHKMLEELQLARGLKYADGIECQESQDLLKFVAELTCYRTKKAMEFQAQRSSVFSGSSLQKYQSYDDYQLWNRNPTLQQLMALFWGVLKLSLPQRQRALAHLERDLSRLSANESSTSRADVARLQEELWRTLGLKQQNAAQKRQMLAQISLAMERVDSISLGLEHFFRELGQIYEITLAVNRSHPVNAWVLKSPEKYAELLISGHAIELLNGDSSDIPDAWFSAICNEVCKRFPKLRIFVVSILGLQSSGKSTLLNALFACRFAVSVGRCTRGLFMRLLFLERELTEKLNVDAILLIDTEGLGAPEKANDVDAERKDRLLATFVMGVSNLTIINVLGEYMRDITDILQIAIVAMARLEQAGMSPDILMVQHLTERNMAKSSNGAEQFRQALEKALEIVTQKEDEIGTAGANCLQNLTVRLQPGQNSMLKQFRPFKDGASAYAPPSVQYHEDVTDLYLTILQACQQSQNKMEFANWHQLVQSYWSNSVSTEHFAVQFKNVKEIMEFIRRGKMIAKVKEAIDAAFRVHSDELKCAIRTQLQEWFKAKTMDDQQRETFLQNILKDLRNVPKFCQTSRNNSAIRFCQECEQANEEWDELHKHVQDQHYEHSTMTTIQDYVQQIRQSTMTTVTQMLDALLVKKNYSTEFTKEINRRLKEELDKQPPGKVFTEFERNKIVDDIWSRLYVIASTRVNVVPVKRQIDQEVQQEYNNAPKNHFWDRYNSEAQFSLSAKQDTFSKILTFRKYLNESEASWLKDQIGHLVRHFLNEFQAEYYKTGMIRALHKQIRTITEKFEETFNIKLATAFKWGLQVYGVKGFITEMEIVQLRWDNQNSPILILVHGEKEYRSNIHTRLQYGFSFASEGFVVAKCFLNAIRQKSEKAGNDAWVRSVLDLCWIHNSQNIRLEHFRFLANEIQAGRSWEAIGYFLSPEARIMDWFRTRIGQHPNTAAQKEFGITFSCAFNEVYQAISNMDKIEDIQQYVEKYITNVDGVEYNSALNVDHATPSDIDVFRKSIMKVLDDEEERRPYRENVTFINPATEGRVINKLGCTKACFWCGALCWGERGHDANKDDTHKHHACHQPCGLKGVSDNTSEKLLATPCDKYSDTYTMYWGPYMKTGLSWHETKKKDEFIGWKFQRHNMNLFNNLMCWFFFKLHKQIAFAVGKKPAEHDDLQTNNCVDVDFNRIMAKIVEEIE